jgi:hypothetical protein
MQESALELAVEEAILRRHITDSLVTLGQRNQRLLSRQLAFITDLERDETDPDTLADLFFLDHLAIRMRRNAESLLVLAGFDPPRKWVGPTPIMDIIRAALGETEEYKRVWVQDVESTIVAGSATAELSHLLAELIENALMFSPRGKAVEVNGWRGEPADGGGYTVTVRDSGSGMSDDEIAQANRRLAGSESFTIAPSKYMGHYVTGKLAARHGITVQLRGNAPEKGITATIAIPPALLSTTDEAAPDVPRILPSIPAAGQGPVPGPANDPGIVIAPSAVSGSGGGGSAASASASASAAPVEVHIVPPPPPDRAPIPLPVPVDPPNLVPLPSLPAPMVSGESDHEPPARKPRKRKGRAAGGLKLPVPPPSQGARPLETPDSDQAS